MNIIILTVILPYLTMECFLVNALPVVGISHHSSPPPLPSSSPPFSRLLWFKHQPLLLWNNLNNPRRKRYRNSSKFSTTTLKNSNVVAVIQQPPANDNNNNNNHHDDHKEIHHHHQQQRKNTNQWGMTIALCTSYFTVMGAKCALPSVLSLLLSPTIGLTFPTKTMITTTTTTSNGIITLLLVSPQQMMAQQLTIATLSVAMGKLVLGPIIDQYGGKLSLQLALLSLCICLFMISICQSFYVFGIAWIIIDFIFSACWPACITTIHEYYTTPTDWSTQIGYLAASARAGNTMAFLLFASIIHIVTKYIPYIQQSWRPVFFIAACMQLIPFTLLSIYGKQRPNLLPPSSATTTLTSTTTTTIGTSKRNSQTNTDFAASTVQDKTVPTTGTSKSTNNIVSAVWNVLQREVRNLDFWFHLINRSMLMIYGSFLLFVPTYMIQIFRTTNSYGAQIGSIYALGCLLSVTTLSKYYPTMMKRTKLWCITLLLLFGATGSSLLQLAHVSGYIHLSTWLSSILLFTWGFSFAVPFYIPPSLYALSRGGTSTVSTTNSPTKPSLSRPSTATITDIFDILGFTLLAMFNGYVTGINHSQLSAWIPTFAITSICATVSFLALFLTTWRE